MAAGKFDILADQGSEYRILITLKDKDGNRKDLTDYTGRAQIRRRPTSTKVDGEFIVEFITPRTSGSIILILDHTVSSVMKVGDTQEHRNSLYVYSLELYAPVTLKPIRILDGTLKLSPEVTRI